MTATGSKKTLKHANFNLFRLMIDMETKIMPNKSPSKSLTHRNGSNQFQSGYERENFLRTWIRKLEGTVSVSNPKNYFKPDF